MKRVLFGASEMQNFEKFTNYSQEILAASQNITASFKNFEIQPEHILLAMIKDVKGISGDYLSALSLQKQEFIDLLISKIKDFPTISGPSTNQFYLSAKSQELLDEAKNQHTKEVRHLLN